MRKCLEFQVPGPVRGQGRPRAYVRNGHASTYTAEEDAVYRNKVQIIAADAMRKEGFSMPRSVPEGGYTVTIEIVREIPRSFSRKKAGRALRGEIAPLVKPDLDNVAKMVLDGLNGIVYADDRAVTELMMRRYFGEQPSLKVMVLWDEEGDEDDE